MHFIYEQTPRSCADLTVQSIIRSDTTSVSTNAFTIIRVVMTHEHEHLDSQMMVDNDRLTNKTELVAYRTSTRKSRSSTDDVKTETRDVTTRTLVVNVQL